MFVLKLPFGKIINFNTRILFNIIFFRKGQLLGIGNPLLDLTVTGDAKLLEKYKLEANNAVIANEFQKSIYKDLLENYDVQFTAGGSVQNSLRVCQWIVKESRVCIFMGSVGMDKYSKILQQTAESDGVEVRYQYHEDIPTGKSFCHITVFNTTNKFLSGIEKVLGHRPIV